MGYSFKNGQFEAWSPYFDTTKFDESIKYLTDAYNYNSNDPSVIYNLSVAFLKKSDFKSALKMINKCLAVDAKYAEALKLKREIISR